MPVQLVVKPPQGGRASAPQLDAAQRSVVQHRGGPLLVLAGPGTGKTSTIVEVVVDRIERGELTADQILVLTFSRKAADELRARIAARIDESTVPVPTMTFHSFCYGLVREFSDPEVFADPPTLMTVPEQHAVMSELLAGHDVASWPQPLQPAIRTRGFASEVLTFVAQLASKDLRPQDLRGLAAAAGRADWARVADAIDEYYAVADAQNLSDYSDVVTRAATLASTDSISAQLRDRYRLVIVDEYQDTDPLQVRLLHHLAGDGRELIVVGDHDQAIYGFRGADTGGIESFASQFSTLARPVTVHALNVTRRFGSNILDAAKCAISPLGQPAGLDVAALRTHRHLISAVPEPGEVLVETYRSAFAESEHIVERLRRSHLDQGLNWSQMAVLVRSSAELSRFQRALVAAGVPTEVHGDDLPLSAEPAVRTLLSALEAVIDLSNGRSIDPELAQVLLMGPLAGVDSAGLRRIGRHLRRNDSEHLSQELIARALSEPVVITGDGADPLTRKAMTKLQRLASLLRRAAQAAQEKQPVEQVLWILWKGTDWPASLMSDWSEGGQARVSADQDLDAVCSLFRHAARVEERRRHVSAASFVEDLRAQQLPADQLSVSAVRPDAVQLMTAHRSKGLEWPLVIVAGVQESRWPDLRYRGSLLQPERLDGSTTSTGGGSAQQERRLFYVALTRAQRVLIVTAVESGSGDGDQPSRYITELRRAGIGTRRGFQAHGRPERPLSLRAIIAQLRSFGVSDDAAQRSQAARVLADIATHNLPVAKSAHPEHWWGTSDLTFAPAPVRDPDLPLRLSASAVSDATSCSLNWFLKREAKGGRGSSAAQGFGLLIHALAAEVVEQNIANPDPRSLQKSLDQAWHRLGFNAPWISDREREEAHAAIARFARWHQANPRMVVAAEHEFSVEVDLGVDRVVLAGAMDRVELDSDGLIHVVDLKTGSSAPTKAELAQHPQLGVYQVAVNHGATDDLVPGGVSGGSELVQLRLAAGSKNPDDPKVQPCPPGDEPFFAMDQLRETAQTIRTETWTATPQTCKFCEFEAVCPAKTSFLIGPGDSYAHR